MPIEIDEILRWSAENDRRRRELGLDANTLRQIKEEQDRFRPIGYSGSTRARAQAGPGG